MASPFSVFRKYSGGLMIILVIVSMFVFTLDSLFMDSSANLWLLGILVGGAVFGIAGIGQGRWLQWGVGGAILGAALGFILPGFTQQGGIDSTLGVIDEEDIYDLQVRRGVANRFIVGITEAALGEGTAQFARTFNLGRSSEREDVIFGKLMRAEADRLGITVDQRMVQEYLNQITGEQLTKEAYIETRNALGYRNRAVDDDLLIDILSDEIKAMLAFRSLQPGDTVLPPSPEVYWQYFRRLNVRQQLDLAGIEVDAFLDEVGEPSDAEINELFAQYSKQFPGEEEPGAPGFRQPFEVELAYLEVDSKAVADEIKKVTDEDIQKYYDDNKESPLIRVPVMPDADEDKPADPQPTDGDKESATDDKPAGDKPAGEDQPAEDPEAADAAADKPAEPEAKADTPAAPEPAEPQPESADEKASEEGASDDDGAADPPAEESTEAGDSDVGSSDSPETPAEESAPDAEEGDSCSPFGFDESADSEEEATENNETSDESASDEKAADDSSVADESPAAAASDEGSSEEAATEPTAPADESPADGDAAKATDAPEEKSTDETTSDADADPLPLVIPKQSEGPSLDDPVTIPEQEYMYRELDDQLKSEIRDEIQRQRVQEEIDRRVERAKLEMETLAAKRASERFRRLEEDPDRYDGRDEESQDALKALRSEMQPVHKEISDKLAAFAKQNKMAYVTTPLLGQLELMDQEDYPIGSATEPNSNPMLAAQSPTVAMTVFQGFSPDEQANDTQLFIPRTAVLQSPELDASTHHYVYWVTDYSYSHVPTLEEVRDEVILTWKRLQARDLVQKRAEELAEQVRSGLKAEGEERKTMAEILKDATVAGQKESASVAVKSALPFSWMRTSSATPNSFQRPQVRLSTIQFDGGGNLDMVGNEFMETVFNELNDEEVGIVPNADRSVYYVVHVKNRFPTPEIGEDGLRERFANEGRQFAFRQSPMMQPISQDLQGPAFQDWVNSVWRRYGIDPDGNPDEE